ncbi:MAG: glycosyltransferase family 39 protein [Candidatus Altiarchaeota archaeon]
MYRSHGFPFVIGLLFSVFGVNLATLFILNTILGTLSVVLIFLLTYLLFKNEMIGLYASFLLSISTIHIIYSISAQSIITSLFFILSSLILYLISLQIKKNKILLLFAFLLVFTTWLRYENLILLLIFLILTFVLDKNKFNNSRFLLIWLMILILVAPTIYLGFLFYKFIFSSSVTGVFSIANLVENASLMKDFLKGNFYPSWLNFFFLLGVLEIKKNKHQISCLLLLTLSYTLFYLFFYSSATKHYTIITAFIIIFSALGINKAGELVGNIILRYFRYKIKALIHVILLLLISFSFYPYIPRIDSQLNIMAENPLSYEMKAISELNEMLVSSDCYVIMKEPTFSAGSKKIKTISTQKILSDKKIAEGILNGTSCLLYFEDIFCTEYAPAVSLKKIEHFSEEDKAKMFLRKQCNEMHETFVLEPKHTFEFNITPKYQEIFKAKKSFMKFTLYTVSIL